MLKLQIYNVETLIWVVVIKNEQIKIIETPQYVSDCLQILKCILFHSKQNISIWLVALYTVDRNWNFLYRGLSHHLWSILLGGWRGLCSLWAHKCSHFCCAHNLLLYSIVLNDNTKCLGTRTAEHQTYWFTSNLPCLHTTTKFQKCFLILSSAGLNITLPTHSYCRPWITDVNSNCMLNCVNCLCFRQYSSLY
jgi:hypothetical protein